MIVIVFLKYTGWAALTPFSARKVYRGVAEVSIYIASSFRGKGTGSVLMEKWNGSQDWMEYGEIRSFSKDAAQDSFRPVDKRF